MNLFLQPYLFNDEGGFAVFGRVMEPGNFSKISAIFMRPGDSQLVITAASNVLGGHLKLISWQVLNSGLVFRLGDSGTQAGQVTGLNIEIFHVTESVFVTAVSDSSQNLILISWVVTPEGTIIRLKDSGDQAGQVFDIRAVEPGRTGLPAERRVVTAVKDGSGELALITWGINGLGEIIRRNSTHQAGEADSINVVATGETPQKVVTPVRDGSGKLVLILWDFDPDSGGFSRLADTHHLPPTICSLPVRATRRFYADVNRIITVVPDTGGELLIELWRVERDNTIRKLPGRLQGGVNLAYSESVMVSPQGSSGNFRDRFLVAALDVSTNLSLLLYRVENDDLITSLGSSGSIGSTGTLVESPLDIVKTPIPGADNLGVLVYQSTLNEIQQANSYNSTR